MLEVTGGKVLGFIGFVCLAATWHIVHETFGREAGFRFWGALLLASAVVFSLLSRIPIHLGERQVASLEGWRKLYAIIPMFAIGLAVVIWPTAIACSIALRGYQCS
jgi:hypothetical protein